MVSVLSLVGLGAVAQTAAAQTTPGITTTILHNGSPIQDGAVVNQGDTLRVNTQYSVNTPDGAVVTIGIPEGVTLDESSLDLPPGNTAIESITQVDGGVRIQFRDPMPEIQDGMHSLDFTFDSVEHTESQTVEWQVDGETVTWEITNVKPGDHEENVSNWLEKSAGWVNLDQYVSVTEDGDVVIDDGILDEVINYTLTIHTDGDTDRSEFSIADELSEYLAYNDDFSASITTWDEDGWNQETNDFDFSPTIDGNSFFADVDITSPSQLEITYSASVSESELDNLRDALQAAYDELDGDYGDFNVALGNSADLGGETREATTNVGGRVDEPAPAPGPNPGQAFGKSSTTGNQDIELDEDDNLVEPIDVTYTLTADLSQWDGEAEDGYDNHEDFELDRNVVISDNLPSAGIWNTDAEDFITADGIELNLAADFDGDAAAFGDDGYVGQYAVVGQNLFINIGQNPETSVAIDVRALVTSIEGLWPWEGDYGAIHYAFENDGAFHYRDGDPYKDTHRFVLIDRGDTSGGIQDPNRFSKNAQGDDTIYVAPGDPVTLDYEFVVSGVDVTNSYIVDYRDPNVFDLSDLDEIQASISGQYDWWHNLTSEHFDVSTNDDGNLVIALSAAGVELVEGTDSVESHLVVNIPLTTVPLSGQQTISIENSATLFGEDDEALYWSETTSEGSSYGNEAEVRKTVRDTPNQEWTQNLRAEVVDGELVQDTYVYNLAYIPHGTFSGVPVTPAVDELPDNLEFLGFVTTDNVDTGDNPVPGPVDIGGNLEAVYDEDAHTVTVQQKDGTVLVQEPDISANVLVEITEFDLNVPVVNTLERSTTTITPSDGYPLSIAKVDSEDDEVVINDPNSRFQILDADGNVVVVDAFVENGFLRVLDENGDSRGLVVSEPGTYYVEEIVAPEGYELSTDRIQVVVDEDGSSSQVTFPNVPADEPVDPTYAIGDYVWIDSNDNGIQDEGEEPLEDVTVVLYDGDGVELDRTTTNDEGRYIFDELPAGEYQVQFILTEEQAELYEFTSYTEGEDTEVDSNAGEDGYSATIVLNDGNEFLTSDEDYDFADVLATEGIDPTWDAGVVLLPQPAVGIIKGDGDAEEGTIENDANTADEAVAYGHEETRDIVINVTNTGDEDLVDVVLTDETLSGAAIEGLVWTTPDGTELVAEDVDGVLTATWDGPWAPEEVITGVATLTLSAGEELHTNDASVEAVGAASGIQVQDEDPYNALPPEPEPQISVTKNDEGDDVHEVTVGEHDIVVTITNDGTEALTDLTFTDTTESGQEAEWNADDLEGLEGLVLEPGDSYTVNGTVQVDAGETHRNNVVVTGTGVISGLTVDDEDPTTFIPPEPSVSVGDFVWVDTNRDGIQDEGEPGIPGVTLVLTGPDGEPVTDVNDNPVEPTVTDEDGFYTFDDLPVLEEGESYTVSIDREASEEALAPYVPTLHEQGDDPAVDSSTWSTESVLPLTEDGDRDPTLDFGFVTPSYAVGDYVWIDANNDGIQDDGEDPLPGVTVELYGVDEEGNRSAEPIETTTTDENGRYIFDELPAGDYEIRFILTEEQADLYEFTQRHAGEDAGADSNADPESGWTIRFTLDDANEALTLDYTDQPFNATQGIDPTWDAGVVLLPVVDEPGDEDPGTEDPTDPAEPEDSEDPAGELPRSGVDVGQWALVLAGLMVLMGGALGLMARSARARS